MGLNWTEKKLEIEQKALKEHERLSTLFKKNRFEFERERRRLIKEVIDSASNEELKKKLLDMQADWDRKMKGAGSNHNRFVLAQTLLWEHFHEVWQPSIKRLSAMLNGKNKQ